MVTYDPVSTGLYVIISGSVLVTHVLTLGRINLNPWTPEKVAILAVVALLGLTWKTMLIIVTLVSVTTYCIFKDMFKRDNISETFNLTVGLIMSWMVFDESQQLEFYIFIIVFSVAGYDKFIIAIIFAMIFPLVHYQSRILFVISIMDYIVLYLSIRTRTVNIAHCVCICACNIAMYQHAIMRSDVVLSVINMVCVIMYFIAFYYASEIGAFFWPDWCEKMKLDWYINIRDGDKRRDIKMNRLRQIFFPPVDKNMILIDPELSSDLKHAFVAEFCGNHIKIHNNGWPTTELSFTKLILCNIGAIRLPDGITIPKNSVAMMDMYYLIVKILHKLIGNSDIGPKILQIIVAKNCNYAANQMFDL